MENNTRNPLRPIISATTIIFILLLMTYIGLMLLATYDPDLSKKEIYQTVTNQVQFISTEVWVFISPFLQITVLLLIVDWIFGRLGINLRNTQDFSWNVQTVIALVITGSFALAALTGIQGVGYLKDLALVVVGFYFGSQRRLSEIKQEGVTITTIEEHDNKIGDKSTKSKNDDNP